MDNLTVRRDKLSFDGFGINAISTDEPEEAYSVRIAKLNLPPNFWAVNNPRPVNNPDYSFFGRLFEKSPDMLEMLKDYISLCASGDCGNMPMTENKLQKLIDYIEKGVK